MSSNSTMAPAKKPDNSLADIFINVIIPVVILSYMSKEEGKLWHLGPIKAMVIALALPLGYGLYHFSKTKKLNMFSAVGLFAILLTGLITIYLFQNDASRPHVGTIFGIKEAIQPLVLGSLFLITHRMKTPLLRTFLYNDSLFDIPRIEKKIDENGNTTPYNKLLWRCTLLMFGSFCISAVMNLFLSIYFFQDLAPDAAEWKTRYNEIVGSITGWGFLVIGLPFIVVLGFLLWHLVKSLRQLTGMENDDILIPR